MAKFTRHCTPARIQKYIWIVLVGQAAEVYEVECSLPDEGMIRRILHLDATVPILVGRH